MAQDLKLNEVKIEKQTKTYNKKISITSKQSINQDIRKLYAIYVPIGYIGNLMALGSLSANQWSFCFENKLILASLFCLGVSMLFWGTLIVFAIRKIQKQLFLLEEK